MKKKFEIAYYSLQNPNKPKNGDFCKSEFLENVNILLLTLSDGVGSNACDWKASRLGCELFIENFKKESDSKIEDRIETALRKTNQEILLEVGNCEGMKATFSAVVWELDKKQFHYVSIGDSRIYEYQNEGVVQISKDETKSVILRKKDGKPMIIAGVAVVAEGVTNVIGSTELKFEVMTKSDLQTIGFALATDGFYNTSNQFESHLGKVFNEMNFQSGVGQLASNYKENQKDDMTLLMVRKQNVDFNNNTITNYILSNKSLEAFSILELSKAALQGIEEGIKNHQVTEVKTLTEFVVEQDFDFGRKKIGELISLMANENFQEREIYQMILQLMRKSRGE